MTSIIKALSAVRSKINRDIIPVAKSSARHAAGTALVAAICFVNPIAGASLGAAKYVMGGIVKHRSHELIDSMKIENSITEVFVKGILKINATILSWFAGVGAGVAAAALIGFPITFGTAVFVAGLVLAIEYGIAVVKTSIEIARVATPYINQVANQPGVRRA